MDDFEKHRSTLVWVSQKSAWLGMANARLRADTAAAGLPEKHWLEVVAKVSQAHVQRPANDVICRFHWRGTLALQQGFDWRISQLQPGPATQPEHEGAQGSSNPSADGTEAEGQAEESGAGAAGDATEQQDEDATENDGKSIKQEGGGRKRRVNEDADEPPKRSRR